MHRLFVAIRPPRTVREMLLALPRTVPGARWQDDDQLHLTLRFVGEIDRHGADDLAAALSGIVVPRFTVALQGAGHFAQGSRRGSLWIGLTPVDPLHALHRKVDGACLRAGLPSERRAYHPHITVARLSRGAGPADGFFEVATAARSEPFEVDSFGLYESSLGRDGASYALVERYRLG